MYGCAQDKANHTRGVDQINVRSRRQKVEYFLKDRYETACCHDARSDSIQPIGEEFDVLVSSFFHGHGSLPKAEGWSALSASNASGSVRSSTTRVSTASRYY
jgi:hypothetical protein